MFSGLGNFKLLTFRVLSLQLEQVHQDFQNNSFLVINLFCWFYFTLLYELGWNILYC